MFTSDGKQLPSNSRVVVKDDGRYVDMLKQNLSLTPVQVKKVQAIHAEWGKRMGTVRGMDQMQKVVAWERSEIIKILTTEQKKKFGTQGGMRIIKK